MNGYIFERCMVTLICQLVEQRFSSHTDFAKIIFSDTESPANAWRYIRNGHKGKPKRLGVEDSFSMAEALGMDLETLCWKVRREIEAGWTLEQDVCRQEESKRGRPKKSEKGSKSLPPVPVTTEQSELQKNVEQ